MPVSSTRLGEAAFLRGMVLPHLPFLLLSCSFPFAFPSLQPKSFYLIVFPLSTTSRFALTIHTCSSTRILSTMPSCLVSSFPSLSASFLFSFPYIPLAFLHQNAFPLASQNFILHNCLTFDVEYCPHIAPHCACRRS